MSRKVMIPPIGLFCHRTNVTHSVYLGGVIDASLLDGNRLIKNIQIDIPGNDNADQTTEWTFEVIENGQRTGIKRMIIVGDDLEFLKVTGLYSDKDTLPAAGGPIDFQVKISVPNNPPDNDD